MEELIPDTDSIIAGFRLQYLEVLNWGTFNKVRWQIQPNGHNALLTGDIGSGKSTLVDALTCLLVPHNKIVFNKAAGAEGKERNLLSYVKGEYKKEKEEITKIAKKVYLRPEDNTFSVIIGNFYNTGFEENVCLSQIFWIGKEGKVEKLLIISTIPLSITRHFSGFTDITELRKRLRNTAGVQLFDDNFSRYSEHFRRIFGMNSDKAIDLFYQTVSMKSVSSLTDFVREQMLERTDVKEQVAALLKRFDDLNKAHVAVVNSREQYQILKPLTESSTEYEKVNSEIESIEAMLEVVPAWFALQKQELLNQAIEERNEELNHAIQTQKILAREKNDLENRKLGILQDIDNNGGKRLEQIANEINRHEGDKNVKKNDYDNYEKLAKQCGLGTALKENDFQENISKARNISEAFVTKEIDLRLQRDNQISVIRKNESELKTEQKELQSLRERKTQIPGWLVGFRTQLCEDLCIDETELPFAGELLQVNKSEAQWEGAIEKLLHDLGISLLVPKTHYNSVSRYVNDNPLKSIDGRGIKLTYLEADIENPNAVSKQLDNESIFYKVDIKPDTPFYPWLENYLQRSFGDFICADVKQLQHIPYGITKQGLIKSGRIRHTKDDRKRIDDRRNYVLGWSNAEKIKVLEEAIAKLEKRIATIKIELGEIEQKQKDNEDTKSLLAILLTIKDFDRINWQYHVEKIHQLEQESDELLHNNDLLALLRKKKEEVILLIAEINQKEADNNQEIGAIILDRIILLAVLLLIVGLSSMK